MNHYLSFDVESVGLFGPSFAVGWIVVDETGKELEERLLGWDYRSNLYLFRNDARWNFTEDDVDWVQANVQLPNGWDNCVGLKNFCETFHAEWSRCKARYPNLTLVTDCPFPVETNFLKRVLYYSNGMTMDHSPYPLLDVASVLLGAGKDPLGHFPRLPSVLPEHNPVCDARQSIRLMLEAL